MCTHNQCFMQKKRKRLHLFHLKINIFTVVKYCCILHGRVCVMTFTCTRNVFFTGQQQISIMTYQVVDMGVNGNKKNSNLLLIQIVVT